VEKLVRDQIPDIIRREGREPQIRVAAPDELMPLLRAKLVEEAHEFANTPSLEELADLLEVMHAILHARGWKFSELEAKAETKRQARGAFACGWVLSIDERSV